MSYIYDETIEIVLSIFFIVAAVSYILFANQNFSVSDKSLPTIETVYTSMYQSIDEVTWKGSQVQYTLWEIEDLGIPIAVGGFVFKDEEDVIENVNLIFPTQDYSLQTTVNAEGELTGMQFFIK